MVANIKEAKLNSSSFKSSRVRIVILASLIVSLLYLTGCCNQQQQGQAADGGRRDTKGIVAADKPNELPAQPQNGVGQTQANPVGNEATAETATEGDQVEDDNNGTAGKTDTDVVNNIPGNVNPAGAGLTPGEGATGSNVDDSDRVQPTEGENTPKLEEEKIEKVSTDDL